MMQLISRSVAIIILGASSLFAQGAVNEVLARADFARRESQDLQQARSLYETLTTRADLAPQTSAQAWLGLGHCHAVLGAEDEARLAFSQAAQGEGEAAQEAQEILATGDLNVDPQLAARVRRALDLMRTGAGSQVRDAKRSLVLLGPPAIPIIAREAQVRSDDSGFVGAVVGVMSELGGEPAAKFFRDAAASDDDFYRRAVITGVSDIYQNARVGTGLRSSPIKETIRAFLFDKDEYVRNRAFSFAFYQTDLLPDAAQMIRLLESSDTQLRTLIHESMHRSWDAGTNSIGRRTTLRGWAPQVFGSDFNRRASYFKLLRRDLTSSDAALAEAAMKALNTLLSRQFVVETTLPMMVDILSPVLRERDEGPILGLHSHQLNFRSHDLFDIAPDVTLQAVRDLAAAMGKVTMRNLNSGGTFTTDSEWADQLVTETTQLLVKPLPATGLDFVLHMADQGYTQPTHLATWLKKTRATGFADQILAAQGAIPPHSALLGLDEMKSASDAALRSFAPLAKKVLRRHDQAGSRQRSEVWGILSLFTRGDSAVRGEILVEIVREFPKLYSMVCETVLSRDSGVETALKLIMEGGRSEEDLRNRNHLFFALLFHDDPRIDEVLVKAYSKGLISYDKVQNRGGDARPRERGVTNFAFQRPQQRWGFPQSSGGVTMTNYRNSASSDSLKDFPRATTRMSKVLESGHLDAWQDALALLRRDRVSSRGTSVVSHNASNYSRMSIPSELANAISKQFEKAPDALKPDILQAMLASSASPEVIAPYVTKGLAAKGDDDDSVRLRRTAVIAASRLKDYRGTSQILELALADDRAAQRGVRYSRLIDAWPADKLKDLLPFRESKYSNNRRDVYSRLIEELGTEAIPMIMPGFEDSNSNTRLYLVQQAVQLPDERVIPALVERLLDSSTKVREAARKNLDQLNAYFSEKKRWEGWTGNSDVDLNDPLGSLGRQAMKGKATATRIAAIRSLATLGDPKALPILVELMSDEDAAVAAAAEKALNKLNRD